MTDWQTLFCDMTVIFILDIKAKLDGVQNTPSAKYQIFWRRKNIIKVNF